MKAVLAVFLSLLTIGISWAQTPQWRGTPTGYTVADGVVTASDDGESTADTYLLTSEEFSDFVLSFDLTRREAGGANLRAIVVWGIDAADKTNRASFFLPISQARLEETIHFSVAVTGDRVVIKRDGETIATQATVYGVPLRKAPVGLLHYYNYHFTYSNIAITPLDAQRIPPPTELKATALESGAVRLSWRAPPGLEDLAAYEVRRSENGGELDSRLRTVEAQTLDRDVQQGVAYTYRVRALIGETPGPDSGAAEIRVDGVQPPAPVQDPRAVLRIDGSARLSWELPDGSRCAGFCIHQGGRVIAEMLPADTRRFLAPPSEDRRYEVISLNPDGDGHGVAHFTAEATAPPVASVAGWPARHPMLKYSADDVDRMRARVAGDAGAKAILQGVRAQADRVISKPPDIPMERSDDHRSMSGPIGQAANAYAISGEDKYAAWVREAMLTYAKLYPTLEPFSGGRARIVATGTGLYEAVWYVPLICAYDITYDSPVYAAEDHAVIERDLLRPAAELFWVRDYADPDDYRAGDLHYKCYNFQAWFISAVGLTGLLLQDADMVEQAVDGPYGLKHLLAHDVHDDGLFWERSLGYHGFVLSALSPFLEAAYHCGIDLYRLQVRDDYNEDREPLVNYCVGDGDNGPKSLKLMFDGPMYALYGNRTYANVSDSNAGPLRASEPYRIAAHRYRDPKYAWLYWADRVPQPKTELLRSQADLSGEIRLARSDAGLHIAARVTDNIVRNTHREPDAVWQGDALWMGIKWRDEPGGEYDIIYGLSPGDFAGAPPVAAIFNRFGEVSHTLSAGEYAVRRTEAGYDIEFAIPWSELAPRGDENGVALDPRPEEPLTVEFVLYDGDPTGPVSVKEKMLGWSSVSDRYDSAQGGKLVLTDQIPQATRTVNAPRVARIATDGALGEWGDIAAKPAEIGEDSAMMTDPQAGPDFLSLVYDTPSPEAAAFDYRGESFCNNGVLQAGSSLYPSTGFAILRERLDATGLPPVDATCTTLNFGPHGGGHGHPDKLSIVLYADGKQWVPDFGSCEYESDEKRTWTSQTIAHNTLVVDETSQYPTLAGTPSWPCDSSARQARGFLDFFHCDDVLKVAQARNNAVYEGVELRRTVAVIGDVMLDFFEARSDAEHQYDYPLHIDGALRECSVNLEAHDGRLGDKAGYQHVRSIRRGAAAGAITTVWGGDDLKLQITAAGTPGTEVIVCEGITTALDRLMPMLILRRSAASAVFATASQPFAGEAPAPPQWKRHESGAVSVTLETPEGAALIVFNPTGRPVSVDGLEVANRIGLRLTRPDGVVETRDVG